MKKPLLITIIVLVVILILPAVGFFGWFFKEKKPLDIVILDKTVPSIDRLHHRSLTWVLANDRIVKKHNKQKYLLRKDYKGFFPLKPLRSKQFKQNDLKLSETIILADSVDVLYYADTYGVFVNDWYQGISRYRRSRKLYGGLNNNDYLFLHEMGLRDKLVILEYNTFDFPTDAYEKYRVEEDQFQLKSSGWMGQYYASLDEQDVPGWMVNIHAKKYRTEWEYKNPGIVFLKGESDIVVLEEGKHLNSAIPHIVTEPGIAEKYGVDEKVPFFGQFDVIDAKDNKVVSNFAFDVTAEGEDILDRRLMIAAHIPALVRDTLSGNSIYMCGDFSTSGLQPWTACFGSLNILKSLLYSKDKVDDPRRFFWLYYKPLLGTILEDYYNTLDK